MITSETQSDLSSGAASKSAPGDTRRRGIKQALFAVSLANLCFLNSWYLVLYQSADGYFNKLPLNSPTLLALAANLCWFSVLTWCCVRLLDQFSNRWLHLAAHLLFFGVLLLPLEFLRIYAFKIPDFRLVGFLFKPLNAAIVLLLGGLLVWQHRRAARGAAVLVGILSPFAAVTCAKIIFLLVSPASPAQGGPQRSSPALAPVPSGQPRVIWLLFDEMDFRLPFEKPLPNLQLPEFDRLRNAAFFATNAFPPGDCTIVSIPALTTGKRFETVVFTNDTDLAVTPAGEGQAGRWSQAPSVFSEAHALGVNSGLVGWYHPYDRIFSGSLNFCEWYPMQLGQYLKATTFGAALSRQIGCLACTPFSRHIYAEMCRLSIANSLALVANTNYGLLFFHLPPPHKPGVYNPTTGKYTIIPVPKPRAYANNLVLADRTLGQMRHKLEEAKLWDRTWIIISSDHSWRESVVVDGQRDLRVPFLLKSAGANSPVMYPAQFNTVLTHGLIMGIIRGEITNQQSAVDWIDKNRAAELPVTGEPGLE
ncbi:MAG TPA: sulfatase-like hydrolase/transferase [Verrucomicrobiae bacterium]